MRILAVLDSGRKKKHAPGLVKVLSAFCRIAFAFAVIACPPAPAAAAQRGNVIMATPGGAVIGTDPATGSRVMQTPTQKPQGEYRGPQTIIVSPQMYPGSQTGSGFPDTGSRYPAGNMPWGPRPTPDTPMLPGSPFFPGSPFVPGSPMTPGAPLIPATPLTPASPAGPLIPATPLTPASPGAPLVPATPLTPASPGSSLMPAVPMTPAAPFTPQNRGYGQFFPKQRFPRPQVPFPVQRPFPAR